MSRLRYVLGRFAGTLLVTVLVITGLFALVAAPRDPNALVVAFGVARGGGNASAAVESYRASRGLEQSLLARYADFMWNVVTFRWGRSATWERPVAGLVAERGLVTAAYVLPAVLVSTVLGTAVGLYVSIRDSRLVDSLVSGIAYTGYGVPDFWLALVLVALLSGSFAGDIEFAVEKELLAPGNLQALLVPAVTLSLTLFAVQVRYVRSEVGDSLREEFVKTVRAKGVSARRVARHALRHAALPLVSVLFTEFLAVLFLSVFVLEAALGLPGLGDLLFTAVERRDVPVVVACGLIPILVGVYGNFLQDALYAVFDPRAASE